MVHLANFIHFFSISLGLISIYIAVTLKKRSGYKELRSYTAFLIGINLVIFLVHFTEALLRAIVTDEVYDANALVYYEVLISVFAVVRLFMSVAFLLFCHQLIQRRFPRIFLYLPVLILLPVFLFLFVFEFDAETQMWVEGISILIVHLSLAAAMVYGSFLVIKKAEQVEVIVQGMIRPSFSFFILYAALAVLLRVANLWADLIPAFILMLGAGILAMVFNGLNVLYLKRTLQMPKPVIQFSDSQLMTKYGITSREQEIIRLICQGKTNKEIGEILFISPITVRDHTSNIFRKTGVKSRTQLAGLVIERPAG